MIEDYKRVLYEDNMETGLLVTMVFDAMWNCGSRYDLLRKLLEIQSIIEQESVNMGSNPSDDIIKSLSQGNALQAYSRFI